MKQITHAEIDNIHDFIKNKVYRLKKELPPHYWNEIIVSLPNWITHVLNRRREMVNNSYYPVEYDRPSFFYGAKTQPHYANEIVVFYEDYHFSPERFEPQIYLIKVTES